MSDERRPKILLVCGDEPLLFEMHRTLYVDSELYDVLLAPNAAVARRILRDQRIDVLVADADSSTTSGSDLVTWVSRESPGTRMLLLIGVDARLGYDDPLGRASVRCLGTPVDPKELRSQVRNAIDPEESLSGKLATVPFADLIQLLCNAGKSAALHVCNHGARALVLIANGRIVHAQSDSETDIDVLGTLMGLRDGTFFLTPFPDEYEVTMSGDWKHLLMEAAYRLDERNRELGEAARALVQAAGGPTSDDLAPTHVGPSIHSTIRERGRGAGSTAGPDGSGRPTSSMALLPRHRWRTPDSSPPPSTSRWPVTTPPRTEDALAPRSSKAALPIMDGARSSAPPSESAIDNGWGPDAPPLSSPTASSSSLSSPSSEPRSIQARGRRPPPHQTIAPLVDRGFAALHAGDLEAACRLWSEAYRMDPENRTLALNLRRLDAKKQRTAEQAAPQSEVPVPSVESPPSQPDPNMPPLASPQSRTGR